MSKAIEDLAKAINLGQQAVEILSKSHVSRYTRQNGTAVKEHEDSRQANLDYPQMKNAIKGHLDDLKKKGYKEIDHQHFADGIHTTPEQAEHHHHFLEDKDGNRAAVYHHQQRDGKHTVGKTNDGKVPTHPIGTKYLHVPEKWTDTEDIRKSHVKEYTRTTASGASVQVKEHDDKRQAAEEATKAADKHQAGMDWGKPDTKKLQKLHHDAAKKHIDAMEAAHQAGDGESMRHHFHKASMHLGAAGSAGTFHRKDAADNAKAQTAMADHISAIAAKHKGEKTAHDLDHGSSIHLLAMEQHQRASAAHSAHHNSVYGAPEADEANSKAEGHQAAARDHGKSVQHFSGIAIKASDHAYNIGKAADKSKNPEDHKDAAALHRHAASLDYDSEGRAEHEAKAAEHDKKATATDKPAEKKQSASDVLEQAGLKHKPGEGYRPELDPYQNHYGSVPHSVVHQHLEDAGYKYTKKGADWHEYSRSSHAGADRITLYGEGKTIKRATRYSGPHRD